MAKLSVYILAFNEEAKIEDCVKSVTWADEVVVIDSHSTDNTAKIAEELGAKVVQVDFEGFGGIRVAGIDHTQHDWILSIDSDERCTPDAKDERSTHLILILLSPLTLIFLLNGLILLLTVIKLDIDFN